MKLPDYITKNTLWNSSDCECPVCGNNNIDTSNACMTLVGGTPDPNHYWHDCKCDKCNTRFVWEHKYGNRLTYHWYVIDGVVVKGRDGCGTCHHRRKYKCDCGGIITAITYQFGKPVMAICWTYGMPKEDYPKLQYKCDSCGWEEMEK